MIVKKTFHILILIYFKLLVFGIKGEREVMKDERHLIGEFHFWRSIRG